MENYLSNEFGRSGPLLLAEAQAKGRYVQAKRVFTSLTPEQVVDEVKNAGLRGRGGAWFPTGIKWSFMPKEPLKGPSYLVINADEGEPGTFKDRQIMEKDPHLLLEGIMIGSFAIRAETAFLYIRGEYLTAHDALATAIAELEAAGILGASAFGSGRPMRIVLHRGAGAYICGEETALLNSLEGRRGEPRPKPPFPAVWGAFGRPTSVNNVETLANVPAILERGAAWYKTAGTAQAPGHLLFGISGAVERPGCYELPLGTTARELVEKWAGGVKGGKKMRAFIPGGASTGFLPPDKLDVAMDPESLRKEGTMLGTGGIIVIPEEVAIVDAARVFSRFFRHETCGQCSPCREGSAWSDQVIARFQRGEGRNDDFALLEEIMRGSKQRTICVFPEAFAGPLGSAIKHFKGELVAASAERAAHPAGAGGATHHG
ncbi:MAG: NADH-quinone oxidoreductase subunit NuoF [Planctomycetes bacterium]|nr:NADH-quinone oxidoreductase subunit NuoF [Planctomycetota bacterium]